ncbi:MAG TPA: hypothetical protein VGB65_10175 [Allosphingosinicella sp.]
MPRFYFHVHDDDVFRDGEGLELEDAEAARQAAIAGARSMICDAVKRGTVHLDHRIDVEDESGAPVARIVFRDAVRIVG